CNIDAIPSQPKPDYYLASPTSGDQFTKVRAIAQLRADHAKNGDIEKAVDSFANDLAQMLSVGAEDFKRLIAAGNWFRQLKPHTTHMAPVVGSISF
uniref:hypothetical protein n=1 Tax=Neomicrococcus lactis TaxID=732241 RepID=UPI0022FFCFC0